MSYVTEHFSLNYINLNFIDVYGVPFNQLYVGFRSEVHLEEPINYSPSVFFPRFYISVDSIIAAILIYVDLDELHCLLSFILSIIEEELSGVTMPTCSKNAHEIIAKFLSEIPMGSGAAMLSSVTSAYYIFRSILQF